VLETLGIAAAVIIALPVAGMVYQKLGTAADLRRHPPPGRLVDVGGHRLHIQTKGNGEPTVIFDAGLPGSVLSWHHVLPDLSRLVRAVAYDRAGLGWSDPGPEPRTAERIVEELRRLLDRAGVGPPYILVGHSYGGLTMRLFAALHPHEVAGLVLVDPVGPGEWAPLSEREGRRLAGGAKLCRRAALLGRFGVTRLVALLARAGAHTIARLAVLFISSGVLADTQSTIGPLGKLPAEQRSIVQMFWVQPKFYEAMAGQIEALPESAQQVLRAGNGLEGKPVIVISAANTEPRRLAEQISIAGLSSHGRHIVARKSSHWVQLDEPDLVTGAILEVIADLGRPPETGFGQPARPMIQ
jgi:pimeloyl-ACP methyl ester carboxylesterase